MARVLLRRPMRADGPALVEAQRESRDYHAPWAEPFTDMEGFDSWFARKVTGAHVSFLVLDPDTGQIAGVVNLNEIVMGAFRSAYLGYHGMVRFARRGLMTEAVRQAIDFAFRDLGLHRVEANIQPGNVRSIALVNRLGFRKEGYSPRYLKIGGEWRDHERWALLADATDHRSSESGGAQ